MFWRILSLALLLVPALAPAAQAADPFAHPLKDCHPCRFSPGAGQPQFDLTFVFQGSGDQKALTALDLKPAGGPTQRLQVGPLAIADFTDGFTLDDTDMNFDGFRDLSITTELAADNTDAKYWIYQPGYHSFAPLKRVGDDGSEVLLSVAPNHRLTSRVRDSLIEYADYSYSVNGHRAVAIRKEERKIDGDVIVEVSYDIKGTQQVPSGRTVVGFSGDSPARQAFMQAIDAAWRLAGVSYRKGDSHAAAATMASAIQDKQLALVTSSYPIQNDPGDLKLVRAFNDYGFYLEQGGRPRQAIGVLAQVTDVDADRTIAYLNLGDAQYTAGQRADAKASYAEFRKRMKAAGKLANVPARVAERLH